VFRSIRVLLLLGQLLLQLSDLVIEVGKLDDQILPLAFEPLELASMVQTPEQSQNIECEHSPIESQEDAAKLVDP
jgi:hypothetical protein